jgi:serine/threonine-protein kinase
LTAEAISRATTGLSLPLFWLLAMCVAGTWAIEAARLLKRRGAMAVAMLAASLCALLLLCRELAIDLGWSPGPPLFALVGLPFLLFASTALAILTARSLRGADLGTGIHRYRRLTRLGRGGMGEVWLAVRTGRAGFHRLVVLKRMLEADSEEPEVQLQRFIGEARTSARLHHPNIVSVHDLGQIDGGWFIVMEYLSGVNVLELVRRVERGGSLPLEVIVDICQQALHGLAYAHERGVIHRDISADNLFVSFDGVVKVVDFGIAHGAGEPQATVSGDLFALGCVLHELLFGTLPEGGLPLPHGERPDAPAAYQQLRKVLEVALHPRPERRFADARAFKLALEPVRHALPAVELASWLRENFAERWTREQSLSELGDPTPAEVEALLTRTSTAAPGVEDAKTTRLLGPKAAPPADEQTTRLLQPPR